MKPYAVKNKIGSLNTITMRSTLEIIAQTIYETQTLKLATEPMKMSTNDIISINDSDDASAPEG